ncbi:class I SAM-dependent methyltransferase [Pelagibacteraceae bacterium]|nr:class I SAM-dependent methyltransferase [Pelagibacteraceae bacterium]
MSERENIFTSLKYKIKKFKYFFYGEKFFKKKRYDWSKYPTRFQIIQTIIDFKKYKSYLEIGCDRNQSFSNILIDKRVGVDPIEGGTLKMTSDDFFLNNKENFDIIFIDGLHEYNQVMRDIENSLKFLNQNGVILLHDCLPRTIWNQIFPRINSDWNGDVWKSIVHSRTFNHIDTYTFVADRGIGIIFPRSNRKILNLKNGLDFKNLKYKDYFMNHDDYMNLIYFEKSKLKELFD